MKPLDGPAPQTLSSLHDGAATAPTEGEPWYLVVTDGPDRGFSLALEAGIYRVGKAADAHVVLTDPEVSRSHLQIEVARGGVRVRDLGSKNGSFLGGVRLDEGTLFPGAELRVGSSRLRVVSRRPSARLEPSAAGRFGELEGDALCMRELFAVLGRVAASDATLLLEAETGCGKELTAHAVHLASARGAAPYVICDLGALPPNLVESELFGHVAGAFTGATRDHAGAFAAAAGGTIFLDEIGELPLELQPRLLRAIEQRQVKPVGADRHREVDCRVIAATNRDLEEEVRQGRFRSDLFYRLAVVRVRVPPLRERRSDIARLVRTFLGERAITLPAESLALLEAYEWPGNVRELRNAVERGATRLGERGGALTPEVLGLDARGDGDGRPAPDEADYSAARQRLLSRWERMYLEQLLARCGGNVSRAAREGGIDRANFYRLLRRNDLGGRK